MKFLRQQVTFKKRIKNKWKKPKGRHSKLREKRRGMHKMPNIGYKQKDSLRKKETIVTNPEELNGFKKGDVITLSSNIGAKKKIIILNECIKKGIKVSNYKDLKEKVKGINEQMIKRTKTKKERKAKKIITKAEPKKVKPKKRVVVKKKSNSSKKTTKNKTTVKKSSSKKTGGKK